jgi:hypothetical protein
MSSLISWAQRLWMGESRLEQLLRRVADLEVRVRALEESLRRLRGL